MYITLDGALGTPEPAKTRAPKAQRRGQSKSNKNDRQEIQQQLNKHKYTNQETATTSTTAQHKLT